MAVVVGGGVDKVEVIKVVRTLCWVGKGDHSDPIHPVFEYWDLEGNRLAISNHDRINVDGSPAYEQKY